MKSLQVLLLVCLCVQSTTTNSNVIATNTKVVVCSKIERQALLSFKKGLQDPTNWLSSWIGEDCCAWRGVHCNNNTGHVVKVNLRQQNPGDATTNMEELSIMISLLGGEISPSILELKHLKYLDLSMKNFSGIHIPKFLGSLKSLRYLNLSHAGFGGIVPHQLGNLSRLHYLDLNTNYLHAESLQWLSHLSFVQYLDMSEVKLNNATDYLQVLNMLPSLMELKLSGCELGLISNLPATLVNFTSLTVIDLSNNYFHSLVPNWLFSIRGLVSLNLNDNFFYGPIPGGLQNMTSLRVLDLSYNNFNSTIPDWLFNIRGLASLNLAYNDFPSQIPAGLQNMTSVRVLDLSENNFNSTIPDWLYNLTSLETLDIHDNNLRGSITSAIGDLTSLAQLDLSNNKLEGEIPTKLGNLCKLNYLFLSGNHLSGPLPDQLGQLKSLTALSLNSNSFSGPIPKSFGHLSKLLLLDISYNFLEGEVSAVHFANLSRLKVLYASSNSLVLKVNSNWIPPFQLLILHMGSWNVGPQFPTWLQTQMSIYSLNLSYTRISDEIPTWFWNISSQIDFLDLSHNQIHGELPSTLKLNSVAILLGSNSLKGPLPQFSSYVRQLDLSNNFFSGPVSHSFCQEMSNMEFLDLSDNLLSEEIPNCWKNWKAIEAINLQNNKFTGNVPTSLGSLSELQSLHLRNNQLSGELPSFLQNCTKLRVIDLSKNEFSGNIPAWMGKSLVKLIILSLHSNNFGGSIPKELCDLSSLQILDLAHNNLSGTIPQCFSNFTAMVTQQSWSMSISQLSEIIGPLPEDYLEPIEKVSVIIKGNEFEYSNILMLLTSMDLSDNHLSGEIPKELTSLLGLRSLNLSRNHLIGNIPENIGDMKLLESLDLSINRISGGIPQSMSKLTFLSVLDLSNNSLSGSIPSSTQLQSFNASCFMGNRGLCGPPLSQNCTEDGPNSTDGRRDEASNMSQMQQFYVGMALGFVVGFWVLWGPLLFIKSWRFAYFQFLNDKIDKFFGCLGSTKI